MRRLIAALSSWVRFVYTRLGTSRTLCAPGSGSGGRGDRGKRVYTQFCINCHGASAKGTEQGPDLIRSPLVLRDRLGDQIGPALKKLANHKADLTKAQVTDLTHFLKDQIEATAKNRNPEHPPNVLTGNLEAGRAYFNGAGKCSTCHSPTGDLAGVGRKYSPIDLQQRFSVPAPQQAAPSHGDAFGRAARHRISRTHRRFQRGPARRLGRISDILPRSRTSRSISTIRWRRTIRCSIVIPIRTCTTSSDTWSRSNETARRSSCSPSPRLDRRPSPKRGPATTATPPAAATARFRKSTSRTSTRFRSPGSIA